MQTAISIGSPIAKVFESCVTDIISFAVKNIIFNNQHGFCKGRSTATNLFVFTNYVIESMELGYSIDCVYTDMSKAFDRINVNLLIAKLAWLGFDDPLLSWLKSYLSNRKQFVLINGIKSRCIDAVSGVPQGSHLGPVLITAKAKFLNFWMFRGLSIFFSHVNLRQDVWVITLL